MSLTNHLRKHLVEAAGKDKLKHINDQEGHKLAHKLYLQHCSDHDMSHFPSFYRELDDLIHKHCSKKGGGAEPKPEDEEEEDISGMDLDDTKPENKMESTFLASLKDKLIQAAKKPKVTIKKWQGDDLYSWAVFIDGKPKWDGMSRSEAEWRKKKEEEEINKKYNKGG